MNVPMVSRQFRRFIPLLFVSIALGCGSDSPSGPGPIASVTINGPATTVLVARTLQLEAFARDSEGFALTGFTFEWSTSDATIATVTQTGRVTGVAVGKVTIFARASGHEGSIQVTVETNQPT